MKNAAWPDVEAKAKRLVQDGKVVLQRNGYNNIVANVQGDHGVYTVEIGRDDPASRAITTWTCGCPWDQYAWGRTRQWKKYEGRVCSHALATFWKSLTTPIDEPPPDGAKQAPGEKGPVVQPQQLALDLDDAAMQAPQEAFPEETPAAAPEQTQLEEPEPATMQDLTIPQQPAVPIQDKKLGPQKNPYTNQPMLAPPDPREQQLRLFNFPGALSSVYPHLARIDMIPVYATVNDYDQIVELLGKGLTPIVQAVHPIMGELTGGKIPVPDAEPEDYWNEVPLYHYRDLGWDPAKQQQAWPRRHGPAEIGRMAEIPAGSKLEVWSVDTNYQWLQVAYSTNFGRLQHHLIKAWAEADDVRLVGDQRTPFIGR